MKISKHNQLKYEKALEYEIFTKGEYNFSKNKIKNAKCIFDIGGHIGYFSKRCRTLNLDVKIHYFEPIGEFYERAKALLGNDKNIILNNYGISYKNDSGIMLLNPEKTMQSSKYSSFLNSEGVETVVNFISLEHYLELSKIDKIDVLKMDIEGMEFEVLSSRGDLERKRIENLIIEIHLLNEGMKTEWIQILHKIKNIYSNVEIIEGGYHKDIFLLRAEKKTI